MKEPAAGRRSNLPPEAAAWPMEAERLALADPLLECLAILARRYGRRTTAAALAAGLPLQENALASPAVFIRAAERLSMTARVVQRPLDGLLESGNLPCILVLKNSQACILQAKTLHGIEVIFPETPDAPTTLSPETLRDRYAGYAFFARPHVHHDPRAGKPEAERGWFWSVLWRYRRIYRDVALSAVFINLLAVASPLFTMNVYDRVVPSSAFSTLWFLAFGVLVAFVFDFMLKNIRSYFVDEAGRRADDVIAGRIFEQLLGLKMAARPPSVGVHASQLREFDTLRDFFTSATLTAVVDFPFVLLFIILIWMIAGPLAAVPASLIPIVLVTGFILQKPLDHAIRESMRENITKSGIIFETLSGLETIKAQTAESMMQREWEDVSAQASKTHVKARTISSFGVNFALFAANLSSVIIVVWGVYMIAEQRLTMGALIAAVILSSRAMAPLAAIAALLVKLSQSWEALHRLDQLMHAPLERPAGHNFSAMPVLRGSIEFDDVTFRYPGQKTDTLKNVSFRIEPGEHVAIIGPVGSGKTTISRLLLNLYQPDSGIVRVDGLDVRQVDPTDLRRNIGVVQQTPYIFFGSARRNITLGHPGVPDSAALRAAELSGAMDFLRDSEAGLERQVGERGESLSGGQRQALAIARALLYDPPVLLLDEPTVAIDPGSERRLYERLKHIIKGKTVILVTHKGAVLDLADKLILMDRGRVLDIGPRQEIIRKLQMGAFRDIAANE